MNRKQLFLKYCLINFLSFFVVLLPCIPLVYSTYQIVLKQVLEYNEAKLEEGLLEIEQNISKMSLLEQHVRKDPSISFLVKTKGILPTKDYMHLYNAFHNLSTLKHLYPFSPYYFVLFPDNDCFISSYQCSDSFNTDFYGTFIQASHENQLLSASTFRQLIFNQDDQNLISYIPMDQMYFDYNGVERNLDTPTLCILKKSMNAELLNTNYAMCFVVTPDILKKLLLTDEWQETDFLRLQDSAGTALLQSGQDDGSYYLLSGHSEELGWTATLGIPKKNIEQRLNGLFQLIGCYILVGLTVVLFLTLYTTRKQYRSIRKLYAVIPAHEPLPTAKGDNEYDTLHKIFTNIVKNSETHHQQLIEINQREQAIIMENLIVRGISTPQERCTLEHYFETHVEFYCVAMLELNLPDSEAGKYPLVLLGICEFLKERYAYEFKNVHSGLNHELFILKLGPNEASNVEHIKHLFEKITVTLTEQFSAVIKIGLSAIGSDLSNINTCYEQARQVLYSYHSSNSNFVGLYHIDTNSMRENPIDITFLQKLYHLILGMQRDTVHELFHKLAKSYQKLPEQYIVQKQQIFFSIRNVIFSAGLHLPESYPLQEPLPEYQPLDTIHQMTERLLSFSDSVITAFEEKRKIQDDELKIQTQSYIDQNYCDPELSITHVCGQMGISEKYLQQIIQENTGYTFAAYLEKLRIGQAQHLLLTTEWNNEKIAKSVGFSSLNTFYRVFQKCVGVSPKIYRQNNETLT